jgi:preprotein translocase subunit SecE
VNDGHATGQAGRNGMMARTNPLEFLQQVRQEAAKVTWPTRRETMITTTMVMIMVAVSSVFFLVVDAGLHWLVERLLVLNF